MSVIENTGSEGLINPQIAYLSLSLSFSLSLSSLGCFYSRHVCRELQESRSASKADLTVLYNDRYITVYCSRRRVISQSSQLIFVLPSVTYISTFYLNMINAEDSRIDDIRV